MSGLAVRARRKLVESLLGSDTEVELIINPELSREERQKVGNRLYSLAFPEEVARNAWRCLLRRQYGVTEEWYNLKLIEQDYCCAICGTKSTGKRSHFDIDHDHATGVNRGLLCSPCNTGIGHFKEDPGKLRKAIEYLVKYKPN
jgi:hypothetical protein